MLRPLNNQDVVIIGVSSAICNVTVCEIRSQRTRVMLLEGSKVSLSDSTGYVMVERLSSHICTANSKSACQETGDNFCYKKDLRVRYMDEAAVQQFDPEVRSFINLNKLDDVPAANNLSPD